MQQWSLWLCLGSTLSMLVGLLVLGWGVRRERWRLLWLLIAAIFFIGAGLGTAEAVYQFSVEREGQGAEATPVSLVPAETSPSTPTAVPHSTTAPTPTPSRPVAPS